MPVVNVRVEKLRKLLGLDIPYDELVEHIASLGMSVEEADNVLKVEYNPNRPDFSSVYGIARALKTYLGIRTGLPKHRIMESDVKMLVDKSVEQVRPFIACAVVKGLRLEEQDLVEIIAMQEDLHWVLGRNRRKVAIGLHDMSAIVPPFIYKAVGFDEVRFVPLKDYRAMTPGEVLVKSEIGRKHAWLLQNAAMAPVIVDARGEVFSMPPIVNASITELSPGRRDVFIDVTGTEEDKVNQALNILSAALAEAGGKVHRVRVVYGRKTVYTPNMKPGKMTLDVDLASKLTGLRLTPNKAASLLRRMGMDAKAVGQKLVVRYPPYRVDILHPVDLVEDISIAYGYNRMTPEKPLSNTYGSLLPITTITELMSQLMIGMGYTEVHNLVLTNEETHYTAMEVEENSHVRLANPATKEYTMLRTSLIPSILSTLAFNKDNLYPQKIYEIGDVVIIDQTAAERTVREKHLAAATAHSDATYSEIKSTVDELFKQLLLSLDYRIEENKTFISGRCAAIYVNDTRAGFCGEISPKVLENIGLRMPVAAFEINIDKIIPRQR
ncbi:MAG: phenylalanine--tRNA ligase subunit beta [Candidatus Caldarchaeum sp.]|nr:phenylalanine--tRNA ligase subunit beta [Candidatus Caldarchaeum sp.]MCX8200912.1 phenylalanine--tRNA ligase subunit beta [Candidatus Caldarchaeum sp.]MDW8435196.1 phenylalanine--tRNA ligase subunit beta [Candidatus Caldarchaeum sp.]